MYIQCTKRLEDAMKIKVEKVDGIEEDSFFAWHANIYNYNRRKLVLLMNNKTRYPIVLYGVKQSDFKRFDEIVKDAIWQAFTNEAIESYKIADYLEKTGTITYAKTNSRSVLGQISDFEYCLSSMADGRLNPNELMQQELTMMLGDTPLWKFKSFPKYMLQDEIDKLKTIMPYNIIK